MVALAAGLCLAQRWRNRASQDGVIYTEGGVPVNEYTVKTAREIAVHSTDAPNWTNDIAFDKDVFTFVRIIRDRDPYGSWSAGSCGPR